MFNTRKCSQYCLCGSLSVTMAHGAAMFISGIPPIFDLPTTLTHDDLPAFIEKWVIKACNVLRWASVFLYNDQDKRVGHRGVTILDVRDEKYIERLGYLFKNKESGRYALE